MVRYKARLVAKGFTQVKGGDYSYFLSLVVLFETLRFLLVHVALHDLDLQQIDVKKAFIYGELDEEIYMEV